MSEMAIVCVDDELSILKSLEAELLEAFEDKYIYEFAETADEAFEVIDELQTEGTQVFIVLSDWLMPGIKGDEFLILVHQKYPQVIKVMLTGQADEISVERVKKEANLYHYLNKPWNRQELVSIIKKARFNNN
jgi:DNA-binding NtrC family response regulator